MAKVTLNDLQNLNNKVTAVNTINNNSDKIEAAMEKTLSRTGDGPNEMEASLDMNSYPIYNLPKATAPTEPIRKQEFDELEIVGDVTALLAAVEDAEAAAAIALAAQGSASGSADDAADSAAIAVQAAQDAQSVSGILTTFATRTAAEGATISVATDFIDTKGYTTSGDGGGGRYARVSTEPTHDGKFQSADGAWWELRVNIAYPKQFGATLDGTTDDSAAIQSWFDYVGVKNILGLGQKGVAAIPTATLTLSSSCAINGLNILEIKRTTDTRAYLLSLNGISKTDLTGCLINTSAGFAGTGSNTIVNGSKTFTVPAGLIGLVVNNFVQITSTSAPINYMIARIDSYSGTTLGVTATTSVGSGTYSDWRVDVYPANGGNPGNVGVALASCTDVTIQNNKITGRFYHGIESRNGNSVSVLNNHVTGYVNRGISITCYTGVDYNTLVEGNTLEGSSFAQYGINCAAVSGGSTRNLRIVANSVNNTLFQGISVGGAMFSPTITGNNIWMSTSNITGLAILVQLAEGFSPVTATVVGNATTFGFAGVYIESTSWATVSGNTCSYQVYGIYWNNGGEGVITGNNVRGASSAGIITDASTSLISITGNRATSYSIGGSGHGTAGNI